MSSSPRHTAAPAEFAIRRGSHFHSAFIDNSVVQTRSDGLGTTLSLTMLRRDRVWTGLRRSDDPETDASAALYQIDGEECVTQEFEAFLEPHNAYRIMIQIRDALSALPESQRTRYALPEAQDAPGETDADG